LRGGRRVAGFLRNGFGLAIWFGYHDSRLLFLNDNVRLVSRRANRSTRDATDGGTNRPPNDRAGYRAACRSGHGRVTRKGQRWPCCDGHRKAGD
jgi:hypothetical protein